MKKVIAIIAGYVKNTDKWLWTLCLGFSGFSILLMYGIYRTGVISQVDKRTVIVQAVAAAMGALAAGVLSKIDYRMLTKLWKLHSALGYGLVLLTFIIGQGTPERPGDKSWLVIPGVTSIQPSEFLKISFILALAYHIYMVRDQINQPATLLAICAHGALPVLLIHIQGDDGSALVFVFIFVAMVFAAGLNWVYIISAVVAMVIASPLVWIFVMNPDQKQRILALYDPNADVRGILYQQYNAKLAIGSGQVWGRGIFSEHHKYVPAAHNDFIFSFIAESLGFVGVLAVLAALLALCVKILYDGHRANDMQGYLICVGVFAMIASQSAINIGMCVSLLPVIGITLPFLSNGGSSILATYMCIGLVLSVYMRNPKVLFD